MPKAFSEEEREEIKVRMMETALDLFHDKGTKSLSIQELTKRVGIAQGSFYHFWKDKDALVLDVMRYRAKQKLDLLTVHFEQSLEDPVGFLADVIYVNAMDLLKKGQEQPVYAQSFQILQRADRKAENRVAAVYQDFFSTLAAYWKRHKVVKAVDIQGLVNVLTGCFLLFANAVQFDRQYFEKILKVYISTTVSEFIEK